MKTKDKHPNIYFLLETGMVLVCKIRSEDYITDLEWNGELDFIMEYLKEKESRSR